MIFVKIACILFGFACVSALEVGVDDQCGLFCDSSFKNVKMMKSCKEGCKEFFFEDVGPNRQLNCAESCVKAYVKRDLSDACSAGCKNQTVQPQVSISLDSSSPFFAKISSGVFKMLDPIKSFFGGPIMGGDLESGDSMVSRMLNQMKDMRTFFSKGDNLESSNQLESSPMDKMFDKILKNDIVDSGIIVGNVDQNGQPVVQVEMAPIGNNFEADRIKPQFATEKLFNQEPAMFFEDDWMSCFTRRVNHFSMITRWMLCIALMLSIVSMIWICLAILRATPRRNACYLAPMGKAVDNAYYTTSPFIVSDKSPMIIHTTDYKAQPLEAPPPSYDTLETVEQGEEKKADL